MNSQTRPFEPVSATPRIAFIQSCWHRDIVEQGRSGFVEKLQEFGVDTRSISYFEVPGAYEIPLLCKKLGKTGDYDAIVAAGFVVDGGIYRHEFVAQAVISGLMQVQLELELPVLSMVLTPHHFHEGPEHQDFFFRHFRQKGHEAAGAVKQLLALPAAQLTC